MIALDSSVVVASFGPWHESHDVARASLGEQPRLPAHAGIEAYSVLTRLPEPFRAAPHVVAEFLERAFPTDRLVLDAVAMAALPAHLSRNGISGGAVYDALVGLTARACGAALVTLDHRAAATYRRCDVDVQLLG